MSEPSVASLVTVEWLAGHLDDGRLVVLDASVPPIISPAEPSTGSAVRR
ncbi:MAG: hypothetical protein WDZ76_02075 [Pseudohongiellaceae bacterium]